MPAVPLRGTQRLGEQRLGEHAAAGERPADALAGEWLHVAGGIAHAKDTLKRTVDERRAVRERRCGGAGRCRQRLQQGGPCDAVACRAASRLVQQSHEGCCWITRIREQTSVHCGGHVDPAVLQPDDAAVSVAADRHHQFARGQIDHIGAEPSASERGPQTDPAVNIHAAFPHRQQ